jgi:hypothetical protein
MFKSLVVTELESRRLIRLMDRDPLILVRDVVKTERPMLSM